jgi:hypothetical protein
MIKKAVYRSSGRRVRGEDDKIPPIKTVAPDLPLDVLRSMDIRRRSVVCTHHSIFGARPAGVDALDRLDRSVRRLDRLDRSVRRRAVRVRSPRPQIATQCNAADPSAVNPRRSCALLPGVSAAAANSTALPPDSRTVLACMPPSPCSAAHTGLCLRTLLAPAVPIRPSARGLPRRQCACCGGPSPSGRACHGPLPRQTHFGMRCVCAVCLSRATAAYCPCARPDRSKHCVAQLSTARSPGPFKLTVSAAAHAYLRVSHTECSYRPERRIM